MFCVVCFIKNRGKSVIKEYSFVPASWIVGDYVYWPKTNAIKLRENINSVPDYAIWDKYKATIKRSNILSLEDALLIEDQYINTSSTEFEGESR